MMKTGLKMIFAGLLLVAVAVVAGCGSGSGSTSGDITLAEPAASNGVVTASATYTPSGGTVLPGQEIVFSWYTVGKTTSNRQDYGTSKSYTNSSGGATSQLILPTPRTEIFIAYVKADTGGLTSGWKSVEVPQ